MKGRGHASVGEGEGSRIHTNRHDRAAFQWRSSLQSFRADTLYRHIPFCSVLSVAYDSIFCKWSKRGPRSLSFSLLIFL